MKKSLGKAKKGVPKRGRFSRKNEPDFWYASKTKNLDNMKLLFSYPEVKLAIQEIREFLEIPENGLKDSEIKNWNDSHIAKCDKAMESPEFQKSLKDIRLDLKNKRISLPEARKRSNELYLDIPANYFKYQVREIIRKFNVPENYEDYIRKYILTGKISAPIANYSIGPFQPSEKLGTVRRVPITVYTKLTDRDLRDLKLEINKYFGNKRLTFIQDTKYVDRDLEIERLLSDKDLDNVTGNYYNLNAEDVAERIFGNPKKKKDILKIKDKLRKIRKNRFGKQ